MSTERELELKFCQVDKKKKVLLIYEKGGPLRNLIIGSDAEITFNILLGCNSLDDYIINWEEKDMRFQIIDEKGDIVDKNLTYESALMYIDSAVGKYYIMQPMKEED